MFQLFFFLYLYEQCNFLTFAHFWSEKIKMLEKKNFTKSSHFFWTVSNLLYKNSQKEMNRFFLIFPHKHFDIYWLKMCKSQFFFSRKLQNIAKIIVGSWTYKTFKIRHNLDIFYPLCCQDNKLYLILKRLLMLEEVLSFLV